VTHPEPSKTVGVLGCVVETNPFRKSLRIAWVIFSDNDVRITITTAGRSEERRMKEGVVKPVGRFVEQLLEHEIPVWHKWDRDLSSLLAELTRVAHEFSPTPGLQPFDSAVESRRFRRAIWLLDRLAPRTAVDIFEPLMAEGKALAMGDDRVLLAWGRRLVGQQRGRIIHVAASGLHWMQLQAAAVAWCASCPDEEIASLLSWGKVWRPAFESPDSVAYVASRPEEEFHRRCLDREVRRRHLEAQLDSVLSHPGDADEIGREIASCNGQAILGWLLRDSAENSGCPCAHPPEGDEWRVWLDRKLAEPAFFWVGPEERELLGKDPCRREWADIWIQCHGPKDWRKLREAFRYFFISERWLPSFFDRLAEIMPSNELGEWDLFVLGRPRGDRRIQAFCRWLAPEYVEALRIHFDSPDEDWAECAYHCYLAKASEVILQNWWRQRPKLPPWQVNLLDRRLFAPEAARPSDVLEDVQDVENDVRLHDPFNWRGY
jgi:hypothetical protein